MSSSSSPLIITLSLIQQNIIRYIYPLWLIFGLTGCTLDLIVFCRPNLRKITCATCKYQFFTGQEAESIVIDFFAASLDHLMTLLVGVVPVLYALNHPDPQIQSLLFCKLRGYIFQICLMLSRWYVTFACLDRYAYTSFHVRLRNLATKKNAYYVIIIIFIIWSIICSHRLIFYEIKGTTCGIVNNVVAALYHSAYVTIGGGILPAGTMMTCACLIRRNLAYKRHRRGRLSAVQTHHENRSIDHQILRILFVQIICYVIFIIPQLGNLAFNTISITMPNRSNEHIAIEQFVSFIAECVLYMFPVTSFYLYTLTSRTFRKELIGFFRSIPIRGLQNQITPTVANVTVTHQLNTRQSMEMITRR
jgi:hypothetical protein